MHWGTFRMGSSENADDPPKALATALEELKVNPEEFLVLRHGHTSTF